MPKITSKQVLKLIKEYVWVGLGGVLNAISLFTFVNPATLIAGGFSGLSSVLSHVCVLFMDATFDSIMSVMYFVLNVPLLICSLIFLRGDYTFKTIWATVVSSIVLAILPRGVQVQRCAFDSRYIRRYWWDWQCTLPTKTTEVTAVRK